MSNLFPFSYFYYSIHRVSAFTFAVFYIIFITSISTFRYVNSSSLLEPDCLCREGNHSKKSRTPYLKKSKKSRKNQKNNHDGNNQKITYELFSSDLPLGLCVFLGYIFIILTTFSISIHIFLSFYHFYMVIK